MSNKELKLNKSLQSRKSSKTDKRDVELTFLKKLNEEYPLRTSPGVNEQGEKRNRTESDDDHDIDTYGSATTTNNHNNPGLDNPNNHSSTNQRKNNVDIVNNKFKINNNAINYAVEQTIPNIKFKCEPKLVEQKEALCLVKELIKLIEPEYKKINRKINDDVSFESWFIDKNGDLICITRNIELLIYLCDINHVPNKILNTNITINLPKHLPPQRS
ncbi:unnamed protein product, partial [Rotaria sp. Silwood2]